MDITAGQRSDRREHAVDSLGHADPYLVHRWARAGVEAVEAGEKCAGGKQNIAGRSTLDGRSAAGIVYPGPEMREGSA